MPFWNDLPASTEDEVQKNGEDIAELLSNLINMSDKDMGKEDDHD